MIRVGGFYPMLLELCFCMTLHDDKGEVFIKCCSLAVCFGAPGPMPSYDTAG